MSITPTQTASKLFAGQFDTSPTEWRVSIGPAPFGGGCSYADQCFICDNLVRMHWSERKLEMVERLPVLSRKGVPLEILCDLCLLRSGESWRSRLMARWQEKHDESGKFLDDPTPAIEVEQAALAADMAAQYSSMLAWGIACDPAELDAYLGGADLRVRPFSGAGLA